MQRANRRCWQATGQRGFSWAFLPTEQRVPCSKSCRTLDAEHHADTARSSRSADQEAMGGPREGGSKTAVAVINARVAGGSATSACAASAGSDKALGKTAADADPEQNAQCEEPCLGAYG